MSQIRADVYKAISENSLNDVVFQDPFSEDARKAKRNLVAASFASILIAALNLQVSGFLGLQTETGVTLASSVTRGLSCLLVMYFLVGFVLTAYIDYAAWKFQRERVLVRPYLDLIALLENHTQATEMQIKNSMTRLEQLDELLSESEMRSQVAVVGAVEQAKGQLLSTRKGLSELQTEVKPLLTHWARIVSKAEHLSWRLRIRFLSLWAMDIASPILLATIAIWKTNDGLLTVWLKVTS